VRAPQASTRPSAGAHPAVHLPSAPAAQLFKSCLLAQGFQEIHTPKIIAGSSEGGSAVFKWVCPCVQVGVSLC